VEFEQKGEDRASYGEKLLKSISDKLSSKGLSETNLKLARQFYQTYPQIGGLLKSNFLDYLPVSLSQSSTDLFQNIEIKSIEISQTTSDLFEIDKSPAKPDNYNKQILERISFSHFVELMKIEDNTKRTFYELQTLKTTLSVKELKRQINTLAYERVGMSSNTEIALDQLQSTIEPTNSNDAIKSIYTFDFLGLKSDSLLEEKDLEGLLLDHLQEFIQELGYGFCFEHRQKHNSILM
jgi:predicted nuclease of restriction endonuclease-like (RecB) superfamily